jgi:hypothetical protein
MDEADAALVEQLAVVIDRIDDDETALVELEVTLDERQRAAADGAETDHHDRASDGAVHGPVGHLRKVSGWIVLSRGERRPRWRNSQRGRNGLCLLEGTASRGKAECTGDVSRR